MNELVRKKLIEIARAKGEQTITYQELSDQCRLRLDMRDSPFDRSEIGRILGEISEFEQHHDRPLLSSLVLTKNAAYEGDGFFKLCESLGYGPWKKLQRDDTFPSLQMKRCYDFWKNDEKFRIHA